MNKEDLNQSNIKDALRTIYDPEIPANIVDLGLIYDIEIINDHVVTITMTLTTMGCPMITDFIESIKEKVEDRIHGVNQVNVNISFDPPWNPSMINEDALLEMGINKPA